MVANAATALQMDKTVHTLEDRRWCKLPRQMARSLGAHEHLRSPFVAQLLLCTAKSRRTFWNPGSAAAGAACCSDAARSAATMPRIRAEGLDIAVA